jgi:predicted DNA-binding WGR domain protein
MLDKLRIGTKLGLGFALVTLLLLMLTGIMVYSYAVIGASTVNVLSSFERTVKGNDAIDAANMMLQDFLAYLATKDPEMNVEFGKSFKEAKSIIEDIYENTKIEANKKSASEALLILADVEKRKSGYTDQEQVIRDIRAGAVDNVRGGVGGLEELAKIIDESVKNQETVEKAVFDEEKMIMEARTLAGDVLLVRDNLYAAVTKEDLEKYEALLATNVTKLTTHLEAVKQSIPPGDIADRLNKCREHFVAWEGIIKQQLMPNIKIQYEMRDPILKQIRKFIDITFAITERATETIKEEGQNQTALIAQSGWFGNIVSAIAVLVAITAGLVLSQNITSGMHRAVGCRNLIAE